jgi:parallel beta-helix repeat protein
LENSNANVFGGNEVLDNDYGIYVDTSFGNKIFMNNFIDNVHGVYSWNSTNLWNYTEPKNYRYNNVPYKRRLGNFWSDYEGSDPFGDGLGDVPYVVVGFEKDHYPLMRPSNKYFVFV